MDRNLIRAAQPGSWRTLSDASVRDLVARTYRDPWADDPDRTTRRDTYADTWPQRCCDCGLNVSEAESYDHHLYCRV
jgi:hypothetical protein